MAIETIGNRYMIVKPIGEGGMATVYLAIDTILKREVAVKVLKPELSTDPVSLERFRQEALAVTSTSHPNIVEIYDVGNDNNKYYIVMEYVHGKTLKNLIAQRGVLPTDEAVNIMKQLVSATANAHRQGIIHRDIKAQNVLVKDDGTVKLTDFGIAQMGYQAQQMTKANTVVGSVHYMAPEVANGSPASFQSDIYALGIVFYELLTGNVPFHGDTAVEIALKHMHNDVPSVRLINPRVPQTVDNIVTRATARNKAYRYGSASKMYDDLVTCLDITRTEETRIDLEAVREQEVRKEKQAITNATKKKKKKKKSNVLAITMTLLLAVVGLMIILALSGVFSQKAVLVKVPDVLNYESTQAQEYLQQLGLKIENIEYVSTDNYDKGIVIKVSPAVGTEVNEGSTVVLTVSLGKNFTIGKYVGRNIEIVKTELETQGFQIIATAVKNTEGMDYGTITYQSIAEGTVLKPDESRVISFYYADHNYAEFVMPNTIIGQMYVEEAAEYLETLGAVVETVQLPEADNLDEHGNPIIEPGIVTKCSIVAGSIYVQTENAKIILYYY